MDDDLLADDGQYKDDGLDDLDNDAEAALLGLSDEEIEGERSPNDEQELEYVDEDGNPVAIGENNADQYEVANIESEKLSNPADEDVLELDLDTELDSFTQETSDLLRESPVPAKSYKERQRKENLIPLTSRNEQDRSTARRKEPCYSPEEDQEKTIKDVPFTNQSHVLTMDHRDSSYGGDELEYDEESEDESTADDHRERFKSERSNIITLTPAKRRTDIPDTLESVLCVEETARVQAYLDDIQRKKRHKPHGRQKPTQCFSRPPRNFPTTQGQQPPQFSSANASGTNQTASAPRRKILINPHFTGIRLPPSSDTVHAMAETHQQPAAPPTSFDTSNFPPPVYSHQEPVHSVNLAPPPIYTAPPPTVQYKHPEYPPQQQMQQMPPPSWQPDMTVPSYSIPPPVMNYGDPQPPVPQPPNYNNYNQNYQNNNYQNPPMPMPQTVNYSQPPPPVNLYSPSFPPQTMNPVSSSMTPYSPAPNQVRMQHMNMQPQSYQETSITSQPQMTSHIQKPRFIQNQRISRPPEKRTSNVNIKHVPLKQPRLEHPQRKTNVHVNNSNIREIPLVDNLPSSRKTSANKTVPIVEDEDEKTKELRMKIEEQKLLREQILKRKEERRRQMAAQRLLEMKKRQAEQSKNTVTIIPKAINQNQVKTVAAVKPVPKPSVKERIGLPLNKNLAPTKKKIVVVRKKAPQNAATAQNNSKPPPLVGQRLKLPVPSQQNTQQTVRPAATVTPQQNMSNKQTLKDASVSGDVNKPFTLAKNSDNKSSNVTQKAQPAVPPKKIVLTSQAQKNKALRLGRPNFQRPQFSQMQRLHRPRIPGPRGAQFPSSPFREPRMHFPSHGPPMNEMRMPPPHFHDPRPPLLPFHPPGEHGHFNQFMSPEVSFEPKSPPFRMRGPGMPNFRPRGMEPPMFPDRFPPPQFANPMPQMRHAFDNNMPRFRRPRFQKFPSNNMNQNQRPSSSEPRTSETKPPAAGSQDPKANQKSSEVTSKGNEGKPAPKVCVTKNQPKNVTEDKDIPKTQSVSIENLSSSTNEAQLRKLCSSVGVVENIQLLKSERKAVIKFKEPRQALNFQKKYQRYMLDLAMIQVSLLSA